ncbi:MAG TPA: hypothetical protein PKC43_10120 [Phycisphaerales bacterium]|nr:hypothetical protein [Phycisphaerales bacterium]HMP37791.1 hypothetical protein [Phycisphaerales bacterium]
MTRTPTSSCASLLVASLIAISPTAAADTLPVTYTGAGGAVIQDGQETSLLRDGSSRVLWYADKFFVVPTGANPPEVLCSGGWGFAVAIQLPAGATVGPNLSAGLWLTSGGSYAKGGAWTPTGIFLGFRVLIEGHYHYGWIHIGFDSPVGWPTARIHGWALHDLPDTPIIAGEIPYFPPPDLDGDGVVDGADLGLLSAAWGDPGIGDLNADGVVDGADLGILLQAWGRSNSPCGAVDSICVDEQEPGIVGCAGGPCCAQVCGIDPHCCAIQWDQLCADRALSSCGADGWPIECQVEPGHASDCNGNGIVDACEVAAGLVSGADCNGDGTYDWCTLLLGLDGDCNGNGIPDLCELADGLLEDCNNDGIPDICQGAAPVVGNTSSLRFVDGPDHVRVAGFGLAIPAGEVTVEFWQKMDAAAMQPVFSLSGSPDNNRFQAYTPWIDGVVYWLFGNFQTAGSLSYAPPESIVGTWQHFAFTVSQSGNFMRIHRNGVLEAHKHGMSMFQPGDFALAIGGEFPNGFLGHLDEFRIWDHARTSAEIAANFDKSVDPSTPGLIASWRFDEASGTMAFDETGTHHGTLIGPPLWSESFDCGPR